MEIVASSDNGSEPDRSGADAVLLVRPGVSPTVRYVTFGAALAALALLIRLLRRVRGPRRGPS